MVIDSSTTDRRVHGTAAVAQRQHSDSAVDSSCCFPEPPARYPCHPTSFSLFPKPLRLALGLFFVVFFSFLFVLGPLSLLALHPWSPFWVYFPSFATLWLVTIVSSYFVPVFEWPASRIVGQLWYELFDFGCNRSSEQLALMVAIHESTGKKLAIGMHPHGVIPLQAILWVSFCDQYLTCVWNKTKLEEVLAYAERLIRRMEVLVPAGKEDDLQAVRKFGRSASSAEVCDFSLDDLRAVRKFCRRELERLKLSKDYKKTAMYGFGAAADVVMYLPVLRNVMGWFAAGDFPSTSPSYKALEEGLVEGKSQHVASLVYRAVVVVCIGGVCL